MHRRKLGQIFRFLSQFQLFGQHRVPLRAESPLSLNERRVLTSYPSHPDQLSGCYSFAKTQEHAFGVSLFTTLRA